MDRPRPWRWSSAGWRPGTSRPMRPGGRRFWRRSLRPTEAVAVATHRRRGGIGWRPTRPPEARPVPELRTPFARLLCAAALAIPAAAQVAQVDPGVPRRLAESGAPVKAWIFFRGKGTAVAAAVAREPSRLSFHALQ